MSTYSLEEIDRNKNFVNNTNLTTIRIKWCIKDYNFFIKYNLSDTDIELCVNSFKKYLEDTLGVVIK